MVSLSNHGAHRFEKLRMTRAIANLVYGDWKPDRWHTTDRAYQSILCATCQVLPLPHIILEIALVYCGSHKLVYRHVCENTSSEAIDRPRCEVTFTAWLGHATCNESNRSCL
jgi:hypothetical protein